MNRRGALASIASLLAVPGKDAWGQGRPQGTKRLGLFFRGNSDQDFTKDFGKKRLGVALASRGWIEGKTVEVVARVASDDRSQHVASAQQLVDLRPDVIHTNTWFLARALQTVTTTIPIVASIGDPVGTGLAKSLARPGGNVTGFSLAYDLVAHKQLGLLKELLPRLETIHSFASVTSDSIEEFRMEAVRKAGLALKLWKSLSQLDAALGKMKVDGRMAFSVPIWLSGYNTSGGGWKEAASVALRHRMASVGWGPTYVDAGGLMAFSMLYQGDMFVRVAVVIDRVLRGANPATMPFEMPERSSLAINRVTAATLGLHIPSDWLLRADHVVAG